MKKSEIVFRAICSFYDGEYAHLTLRDITPACKEDFFKSSIKELISLGKIEDCSCSGYAKRFKISNPKDCVDFLFWDNLDYAEKYYLLEKWILFKENGSLNKTDYRQDYKLQMKNLNSDTIILNAQIIKNKITAPQGMNAIYTNKGYKMTNIPIEKKHHCNTCGEENPEMFSKNSYTRCKKCKSNIHKCPNNISEKLYKHSKKSAKSRNLEYELDQNYIEELLTKQNRCCFYTGIKLSDDYKDKTTYPTIDRIDSSKGYIKGNVCICTWTCNIMKNTMTTEQFKDIITKIYENKNNF